ncbi:hypothetical protein BDU57DRAFT_515541 [Ampelomyces quisqualis]|uniref:Uncharacterized protein n=1 Tax=Ampelomyces quisqualis TaxID=50730 RepID=A0A6A5QP40_AMPQU|nr:hypothetical protein BDU57DRAFT_515541 [Ampelomyces quisqualis]
MDEYEEAVLFTFSELESRLARLEYILGGPQAPTSEKAPTIPDRIHNLEKSLQALGAQTRLVNDARELITKHQDVVQRREETGSEGPGLDSAQKSAMVVERATGFATVASQLKALADQQMPATEGFSKLAVLRPRMSALERRQLQQAMQISELRRRSMMMVQYYKQIHVVGAGRVWADYSRTLGRALRAVSRDEYRRRAEE